MTSIFVSCVFALCLPVTVFAGAIELSSDTPTATAGYYQLNWQAAGPNTEVILYESRDQHFTDQKVLYHGTDLATVISGKSNGQYYYRLTDALHSGQHSNTVTVTVKHHPLPIAFSFFGIGAIVFIATLIVILSGNRQSQAE